MTTTEAINAIGSRFKVKDFVGMPDDHIRQVTPEGAIIGDFTEAAAEDCRFILPQPEHLKKKKNEDARPAY